MVPSQVLQKALSEKRTELQAALIAIKATTDLDQLAHLHLRAARLKAEIEEVEALIKSASDGLNSHPLVTVVSVVGSLATIYDVAPLPDSVLVWCAALGLAFFVAIVKGWPVGFALSSPLPPPSRWRPERDGRVTDLHTGACMALEEAVIEVLRTQRHLGPSALAGELGVSLRRLWPVLHSLQGARRISLVRRLDTVAPSVDKAGRGRRAEVGR